MNAKNIAIMAVAVIIVGAGAFYGGMIYANSQKSASGDFQNFRNLTPEQRQQRMGQNGQAGVNFTAGEIIAKDDKSITVKLPDGGSKIVFLSETTEIMKSATSTPAELELGKTISVNGITNQDGSLTARSIQLRDFLPMRQDNQQP